MHAERGGVVSKWSCFGERINTREDEKVPLIQFMFFFSGMVILLLHTVFEHLRCSKLHKILV